MKFHHIPVLFNETIEMLNLKPGQIIVDATLGGGGHAGGILERIAPDGTLIGIDRDPNALAAARAHLKEYGDSLITVHGNFNDLGTILGKLNIPYINGLVMDLGVSSHQLDEKSRGFSYQDDAPLDMRMDPTQPFSAMNVVNEYEEKQLAKIILEYGEERWAARIAKFIVENRPIHTTGELTEIIKAAIPAKARRQGPHPSKRTFQAIRIEVNGELEILEGAIETAVNFLESGGRLCVITFHSLEDRIVKNTFRRLERPCTCPPDSPICICDKKASIKILTRKPITPSKYEIDENPRSRSAKLRACQKL
ncbi:MAG: 16S rRNA (cytosine(1402)-N(4))-methyltransferase RsmH [Caldicoprobacterales bacterium]|jgi:16S rRNA (cytosine1402-N4)-methyltransferase|nr:16S rRNA (cytosine(1402)-N(4))-methyltransferase RsmH [Clostridiales bacterium]